MNRARARSLSATALGVLAGVGGGAGAGALDYLLSAGGARQFLPEGTLRLGLFLGALYAAAGGLLGGLLAPLVVLLARATDLGGLWHSAFGDEAARAAREQGAAPPATPGRPRWAYALALAAGLCVHGAWVWQAMLLALRRYHSPMLIAALVGAEAAAMAVPVGLLVLALAALLGLLPVGRRVDLGVRVAPAVATKLAAFGALLGAALVAAQALALAQRPRMTPALRAQNAGLWAPLLVAAALALAWLLARALGPRLPPSLRRACERPILAVALPAALLAVAAAAVAALGWSVVRLLPLQALAVALSLPGLALVVALQPWLRRAVARLPAAAGAVIVMAAPVALLATALRAGRADRVQKAASIHASLSAPLLDAIHAAWDLDRDGFSPVLGPDCDDLDADVHPGAFDWPDDGIDQNCNGHQATLSRAPRPPFPPPPAASPRRPNIVLITVDALRWDHVGAYGYSRPTTPRIDELARDAVRFENGWAHSPSTRYSVPAILAGRYESTIAWGSPRDHWPPRVLDDNRLMGEMLREHGYHTAALTSSHYFEPGWGLTQGFDDYDNSLYPLHGNVSGDPARATGSSSRQLADLGIAWVQQHAQGSDPYFLWIHFYDPHYLYERHPDCPDCAFGETDVDLYDGEIRFTDQHIGRLLDALRQTPRWPETLVVLTADHGEGLGEHGVRQHGYHIYSAQNRVPFLVRAPGVAPRVVAEPVGHVDLFPTLLNLLGAPDEPQLLGRSFVDLLEGGAAPRLVYQEVDYEGPTQRKAVASRRSQLIFNAIPDGTYEFYDLATDPLEAHDLFERGAGGEQGRLFTALGEWMDESAIPADFAARAAGNVSAQPLPFERALGADVGGLLVVDGVSGPAGPVVAGGSAEVDLLLHAARRIPPGWHLFAHAGSTGGGFQNLDHEPVEGFVPLSQLRPGRFVRDRISIAIPPAWRGQTVTLRVGLFRGRERAPVRLPSGPAGDEVVAAEFAVAR